MKEENIASTTSMSSGNVTEYQHWMDPSLVKVKVSYPDNYEGDKHILEGSIKWVSREGANELIGKGIGTEEERTDDEQVMVPASGLPAQAATQSAQNTGTVTIGDDEGLAAAEQAGSKVVPQERPKAHKPK